MEADYHVPRSRELHACDLLAGRGKLAREGNADRRLSPERGAEIFMNGLRIIESAANHSGGVEVVNGCLRKADFKGYERVSLDRLLNRINSSVAADGRYAHLIFDEGGENMVGRLYGRLRSANQIRPLCSEQLRVGRVLDNGGGGGGGVRSRPGPSTRWEILWGR